MKKFSCVLLAVLALALFAACTTTIAAPVDVSNNPIGSKVGEASSSVRIILGLIPFSRTWDVPAVKAAQNGGISKIATVDHRTTVKGGFFVKTITLTTIVTGE